MECLLPGITTPADPPDPRDIHELFVALIEGAYTVAGFAGPTAEGLALPLCLLASHFLGVRQITILGRSLQFRFPTCASTLSLTLRLADDQCAGHCCADETFAPATSTAGFSLALQSFVSVSHSQFAPSSADAPVLQILPNRSSRLMRPSHLTRPPPLWQVFLSLSNLLSRVPICNLPAD